MVKGFWLYFSVGYRGIRCVIFRGKWGFAGLIHAKFTHTRVHNVQPVARLSQIGQRLPNCTLNAEALIEIGYLSQLALGPEHRALFHLECPQTLLAIDKLCKHSLVREPQNARPVLTLSQEILHM